jgi:hypothetical protein
MMPPVINRISQIGKRGRSVDAQPLVGLRKTLDSDQQLCSNPVNGTFHIIPASANAMEMRLRNGPGKA